MIPIDPYIKDGVVIVFLILLIAAVIVIVNLKKALQVEKHKRLVPLLSMFIDQDYTGLFLKNHGHCHAKNILIKDINLLINVDFEKNFCLKFDPIDFLNPDQTKRLSFKIFEEDSEMKKIREEDFINYLFNENFEILMTYSNVENIEFSTTIVKDRERFLTKQVQPTEASFPVSRKVIDNPEFTQHA